VRALIAFKVRAGRNPAAHAAAFAPDGPAHGTGARRIASAAAGAVGLAAALVAGVAPAQEPAPGWEGRVVLYGWFAGLEGDVTARNRGVGTAISLSPGDVLDRLETGVFAHGELRKGRFGALVDAAYIALSDGQDVATPLPGRVSADTTLVMVTAAGLWRAVDRSDVAVDLYGGGRFVGLDVELNATVAGGGPSAGAAADDSWLDPIVGVRATAPLTERLTLTALADIGGFGIGSEFSAQVFGGLALQLAPRVSVEAGLRYLHIDRDSDRVDFNAQFWGPTLGLAIDF
jgi:hypothetical protein